MRYFMILILILAACGGSAVVADGDEAGATGTYNLEIGDGRCWGGLTLGVVDGGYSGQWTCGSITDGIASGEIHAGQAVLTLTTSQYDHPFQFSGTYAGGRIQGLIQTGSGTLEMSATKEKP